MTTDEKNIKALCEGPDIIVGKKTYPWQTATEIAKEVSRVHGGKGGYPLGRKRI